MAITTMAQVISGMRNPEEIVKVGTIPEAIGVLHSSFYFAGRPDAAAVPSPGINGAHLTTYAGQIPFQNPASGNTYLARFVVSYPHTAGQPYATHILADRLWHNSGLVVTTTTAQNITFGTLEARDGNGATLGDNIMAGIEVSTVTGNAGAITNTTISYTNQAGTTGKVGTMASFPITAEVGTFVPFELAAGDLGIRSIASITLGTSYVSGAIHLVCYRTLARVGNPGVGKEYQVDALSGGFPRLYNNTVPFILQQPNVAQLGSFSGQVVYTQG